MPEERCPEKSTGTRADSRWLSADKTRSREVIISLVLLLLHGAARGEQALDYVRPNDFMYLLDFLSPIRDAFFLTASVGRPNEAATSAVGRSGNSFLSCFTSSRVHDPLVSLLVILRLLSALYHYGLRSVLSENCSWRPAGGQTLFPYLRVRKNLRGR